MTLTALLTAAFLVAAPAVAARAGSAGSGDSRGAAAPEADLPSERDVWVGSRGAQGSATGAAKEPSTQVPDAIVNGPAEEPSPAPLPLAVGGSTGSGPSSGRWVGAGLLVASLAFAAAWMHRKKIQLPSRQIKILETVAVGPKRSMMLVEVDGERLLVGSSEAGLQVLSTRLASSVPESARTPAGEFSSMLEEEVEADALRRKMAEAANEPTAPNVPSVISRGRS